MEKLPVVSRTRSPSPEIWGGATMPAGRQVASGTTRHQPISSLPAATSYHSASSRVSRLMGIRICSSLSIIPETASTAGFSIPSIRLRAWVGPASPVASRDWMAAARSARVSSCLPHITVGGPVIPCFSRNGKSRFSLRR